MMTVDDGKTRRDRALTRSGKLIEGTSLGSKLAASVQEGKVCTYYNTCTETDM